MDKVKMAVMWNIIREVAEREPLYDGNSGDTYCMYCVGDEGKKHFTHEPDCIYVKARALVEQETSHE